MKSILLVATAVTLALAAARTTRSLSRFATKSWNLPLPNEPESIATFVSNLPRGGQRGNYDYYDDRGYQADPYSQHQRNDNYYGGDEDDDQENDDRGGAPSVGVLFCFILVLVAAFWTNQSCLLSHIPFFSSACWTPFLSILFILLVHI
jgi:hypothetical protein